MNYIEFKNILDILFHKHGFKDSVMWRTPVKYDNVIEFCLVKPKRKDVVFLAIDKNGKHKVFDTEHSFPKEIDDLIYRFLSQDTEKWFRDLIILKDCFIICIY